MDTHTKQMFFAGMFAYVTTVSGLIFDSKVNEAKQDERISVKDSIVSVVQKTHEGEENSDLPFLYILMQ